MKCERKPWDFRPFYKSSVYGRDLTRTGEQAQDRAQQEECAKLVLWKFYSMNTTFCIC